MKSLSPSDRERADLRGPVRTIIDDLSTTVFDRDGRILEWRGNTSQGHSERTYSHDENGKLIRITGSNGDQLDEFRYDEQGRMTQIRHVPARPERANTATGIEIFFEAISEGDTLTDGGTVETSYNERGQPLERRIVDDEGMLLFRIVHLYDANGRLGEERLVSENPSLPKAFRNQIPSEQRDAVLAQIKMEFESIGRQNGLFGNAERTYVYNGQGRVA
jgi:RHS repeat protein